LSFNSIKQDVLLKKTLLETDLSNVHIDYEFFTPQIQMCSDWAIWLMTLWHIRVMSGLNLGQTTCTGIQPLQANSWTIPWWG